MQAEIYLNKYLSSLIANPERVSEEDIALLKDSVQRYPYFQALHLLLAKASIGTPEEVETFATTALHTNGSLLHRFLFKPLKFASTASLVVGSLQKNAKQQENEQHEVETSSDEQETFDEIGEVDIHKFKMNGVPEVQIADAPVIENIEDDFVLENIAATDFFAFEQNFNPDALKTEEPEVKLAATPKNTERETSEITNYDDDTLPYTFLWWLAKTRREHQTIFQPYAAPKRANQSELQQQYVEHIFHLQSPFNAEEILNTIPEIKGDPKDLEIIDTFIKNAPQIGTPRPEQIDNENKAKKSAEDHNDVVSETLAKIYIEQMLYHKAIETYEKLSLKFPEKSRYFADLIQSIKKKI